MSDVQCKKCSKENPAGAKFCSGCATPLGSTSPGPVPVGPPTPPPPPPPQRPGVAGMLGQTGGRVEQRQIQGDAAELYACAERFLNEREDTDIKSKYPPQQISASVMFKDLLATLNSPARVDSEINITPAGAGVCSVSIGSKLDWGSTMTVWVMSAVMLVALLFLFNPYGMYTMLYLLLFAGGSVLQIFILTSRGPKSVAEAFFDFLKKEAGALEAAPEASASAQTSPPTAPVAPAPESPAPESPAPESPETPQAPDAAQTPETAAEAASAGEDTSLVARMRKLTELKDEGLISEEEFETRRAEILKEI